MTGVKADKASPTTEQQVRRVAIVRATQPAHRRMRNALRRLRRLGLAP